jgi:hypothetical protein
MRVSSESDRQTTDLQRDALLAAGVDSRHLFEDHASGARDDRPGLVKALAFPGLVSLTTISMSSNVMPRAVPCISMSSFTSFNRDASVPSASCGHPALHWRFMATMKVHSGSSNTAFFSDRSCLISKGERMLFGRRSTSSASSTDTGARALGFPNHFLRLLVLAQPDKFSVPPISMEI